MVPLPNGSLLLEIWIRPTGCPSQASVRNDSTTSLSSRSGTNPTSAQSAELVSSSSRNLSIRLSPASAASASGGICSHGKIAVPTAALRNHRARPGEVRSRRSRSVGTRGGRFQPQLSDGEAERNVSTQDSTTRPHTRSTTSFRTGNKQRPPLPGAIRSRIAMLRRAEGDRLVAAGADADG
jgi:hypothetical protein